MPRSPHPSHRNFLRSLPHAAELLNDDGSVRLEALQDLPISGTNFTQLDPTGLGTLVKVATPLWGPKGVSYDDCDQRNRSDCYFISLLRQFGLHCGYHLMHLCQYQPGSMARVYWRSIAGIDDCVDTALTIPDSQVGRNPGIWGSMFEKTWCLERRGSNTGDSIDYGNPGDVANRLGYSWNYKACYTGIATVLASNVKAKIPQVICSKVSAPNVPSNHAYGILAATVDAAGVLRITVDNPWDSGNFGSPDQSGRNITLTEAEILANFVGVFTTTGRFKPLPTLLTTTLAQKCSAYMATILETRSKVAV